MEVAMVDAVLKSKA